MLKNLAICMVNVYTYWLSAFMSHAKQLFFEGVIAVEMPGSRRYV
jgi:hypothetical protein